MKNLRFEFRICDENGECIAADNAPILDTVYIDKHGRCETVELYVNAALRAVKRDALQHAIDALQCEATEAA